MAHPFGEDRVGGRPSLNEGWRRFVRHPIVPVIAALVVARIVVGWLATDEFGVVDAAQAEGLARLVYVSFGLYALWRLVRAVEQLRK